MDTRDQDGAAPDYSPLLSLQQHDDILIIDYPIDKGDREVQTSRFFYKGGEGYLYSSEESQGCSTVCFPSLLITTNFEEFICSLTSKNKQYIKSFRIVREFSKKQCLVLVNCKNEKSADNLINNKDNLYLNGAKPPSPYFILKVVTKENLQTKAGKNICPGCSLYIKKDVEFVTTLCNSRYHLHCYNHGNCVECTTLLERGLVDPPSCCKCLDKQFPKELWTCLVCQNHFCKAHTKDHCIEEDHNQMMKIGKSRIWDCSDNSYFIDLNTNDVVELKPEVIKMVTSLLDNQTNFFARNIDEEYKIIKKQNRHYLSTMRELRDTKQKLEKRCSALERSELDNKNIMVSLGNDHTIQTAEIMTKQKKIDGLDCDIYMLRRASRQAKIDLDDSKLKLKNEANNTNRLQGEVKSLKTKIEAHKKLENKSGKEIEKLKHQKTTLMDHLANQDEGLKQKLETVVTQLFDKQMQAWSSSINNDIMQRGMDDKRALTEQLNEFKEHISKNAFHKDEGMAFHKDKETLMEQLSQSEIEKENKELKNQIDVWEQEKQKINVQQEATIGNLTRENNELKDQIDVWEQENLDLNAQNLEKQNTIVEHEATIGNLNENIKELTMQLQITRNMNVLISSVVASKDREIAELKATTGPPGTVAPP